MNSCKALVVLALTSKGPEVLAWALRALGGVEADYFRTVSIREIIRWLKVSKLMACTHKSSRLAASLQCL